MGRQKAHSVTFIHGQNDVHYIAYHIDNLLTEICHTAFTSIKGFEGCVDGEQGLERSNSHHDDHHDWKDGNGVTGHVHDEEIHWNLKERVVILKTTSYVCSIK